MIQWMKIVSKSNIFGARYPLGHPLNHIFESSWISLFSIRYIDAVNRVLFAKQSYRNVHGLSSQDTVGKKRLRLSRAILTSSCLDSRRSGIWHSRSIPLSDRVGLFRFICRSRSTTHYMPQALYLRQPAYGLSDLRSNDPFVRYGAAALATIRTSRQLANSNLRSSLIEGRYTSSPARLHRRTNEETSGFDSISRYHGHHDVMR